MTASRPPFPFIVGCGRSGTTLLRAMLAGGGELSIPPESYFIEALWLERRRLERSGRLDVPTFLSVLAADPRFQAWELPIDDVARELGSGAAGVGDGVRATFRAYARTEGRDRYGDKTPIYALMVGPLAELLPESRFIHLIRDGRDVARSYGRVPWGPRTFSAAMVRWSRHVAAARSAGRTLGRDRYLEVRYEDVVRQPEQVLVHLCEFAEISYSPSMLRFADDADRLLRNTAHRDWVAGIAEPLSPRRDWRRDLSDREQRRAAALAGRRLVELGYDPGPSPSLVERLGGRISAVGLSATQWQIERAKRTRVAVRARPMIRRLKSLGR